MTSKPESTEDFSEAEDAEFLAQLEATFALDPIERVSTYEAMAQKLEAELNAD